MRVRPLWAHIAIALAACGHTEPFSEQHFDTDQPFNSIPPVQLTLNRSHDRQAAWLPDGSAILYSAQRTGADNDVCLAVLPPAGGRQTAVTCGVSAEGDQVVESIETTAPASDGRLAFVLGQSGRGALQPQTRILAIGTLDKLSSYRTVLSLPYATSLGTLAGSISQLQWLGANRLVYLAQQVVVRRPCQVCDYDTIQSGLEVASLAVDEPAASPEAIPGTQVASGVSAGANDQEVYYTLAGDTRVYRRNLSTGDIAVAYDFGGAGIARDVHVVGQRLAAVVGGRVAFSTDPSLGPIQWDSGGTLHLVDLQSGNDLIIQGPGLFRRPRISPAADRIVAEVYPLILTQLETTVDTTVARAGDLYLFGQP